MTQNTTASGSQERAARGPWMTRGLRRHQEKLRRKRGRVGSDALLVGIDLARERQAVSFVASNEVVGRRRVSCAPQALDQVLEEAALVATEYARDGIVVAFEPAGHYWCLAAEALVRSRTTS